LAEGDGSGSGLLSDNEEVPEERIYGLASQLQRSSVSIPANIAEGGERQYTKEFLQYLSMAYGSLAELEALV